MKPWPKKPLAKLLKVQNGFAFKSERFNNFDKGFPIIRIRDLARGFTETFFDGEYDPTYVVKDDDFLIGMDGEFRCYQWRGGKALLNQRVCRLYDFAHEIIPEYVFYGINEHLREIEDNTAFATVKHLSSRQIGEIEITVPPLEAQKQVVTILDEADELRKLRAKADRRTAELIPALFNETFGDPATNPIGWPRQPLAMIANCLDGQRIPVKEEDRLARIGKVPYYGANGQVGWIDDAIFNEPLLLIAEDGGHFDEPRRGVAYTILGPAWVNNHAHVIRPDQKRVLLEYLHYYFKHFDFLPYITGSTRAKLIQKDLMRVEVSIPPLPMQKEFEIHADEIRKLEADQAASRQRLEALFQSTLHRAFGGGL